MGNAAHHSTGLGDDLYIKLLLIPPCFQCSSESEFVVFVDKLDVACVVCMQVLDMINNSHYLYRMTILRAISLLAPVMGSEITCSKLLPVVVTVSKDRSFSFLTSKIYPSLALVILVL